MTRDPDERTRPHDADLDGEEFVPEDDRIIGKAFRVSAVVIAVAAIAVLAGMWLTREKPQEEQVVERGQIAAPAGLDSAGEEIPQVRFSDVTRSAGIDFVHRNGAAGDKLLPETMGSGAVFFDRDGDGDQDLLLVNGESWPEDRNGPRPTMALYVNDGTGAFQDRTADAGLDVPFYGTGAAAADYDNDGDADLFVTAVGPNHLFRNDGGRFVEVSAQAGVAGDARTWSTSAGFFDYDGDGDLDLFVCNYVRWSKEIDLQLNFTLNGVDRAYGPPNNYQGTHSYLYRNDGDGRFRDVSEEAGIHVVNPATGQAMGKALAVTFADPDRDGLLDVFVANDTVQNFAFRNLGDGRFEEVGASSGIGFDGAGRATGAMGIDVADFANEGYLGIGIGNFANEATSFYVQQPNDPWQFVDTANAEGIGSPSRLKLSFGLFFFDYDLDGRLDLLQANGHLEDEINEIQPSQFYRQPAQLFWNRGPGTRSRFAAVPDDGLGDLGAPIVGRGAAFADIDGDGDLDVLLTQAGDRPLLARNDQALGHHWLRVRLVGVRDNRDAVGAELTLAAGGTTQRRTVMPVRSYLSQVELPVTFGLGEHDRVDSLTVRWPSGETRSVVVDAVDATLVIAQDDG